MSEGTERLQRRGWYLAQSEVTDQEPWGKAAGTALSWQETADQEK